MKVKLCPGSQGEGAKTHKQVAIESVHVPDMWHLAMAQATREDRALILQCWHLAHDLKAALLAIRDGEREVQS